MIDTNKFDYQKAFIEQVTSRSDKIEIDWKKSKIPKNKEIFQQFKQHLIGKIACEEEDKQPIEEAKFENKVLKDSITRTNKESVDFKSLLDSIGGEDSIDGGESGSL